MIARIRAPRRRVAVVLVAVSVVHALGVVGMLLGLDWPPFQHPTDGPIDVLVYGPPVALGGWLTEWIERHAIARAGLVKRMFLVAPSACLLGAILSFTMVFPITAPWGAIKDAAVLEEARERGPRAVERCLTGSLRARTLDCLERALRDDGARGPSRAGSRE